MNIYSYDLKSCDIITLLPAIPTDDTPHVTTDQTFDLLNFTVTIGQIDGHTLTWWNPPKPKPTAELIANIKALQGENDILGQSVADMTLQNMQLNSTVDTMGATLVQAQLDIISLKEGVV